MKEKPERQKPFVENVAVGGEPLIMKIETALGIQAIDRKKHQLKNDENHCFVLWEHLAVIHGKNRYAFKPIWMIKSIYIN